MEELNFENNAQDLPVESGYYIYINGRGHEEVVQVQASCLSLSMRFFSGREIYLHEAKGRFISRIVMPSEE